MNKIFKILSIITLILCNNSQVLATTIGASYIYNLPKTITQNITSGSGNTSIAKIPTNGFGSVVVSIPASTVFTATLVPKVSIDGINFYTTPINVFNTSTTSTSITAPGTWIVPTAGMTYFELQATSYTSGTIPVTETTNASTNVLQCVNCNL